MALGWGAQRWREHMVCPPPPVGHPELSRAPPYPSPMPASRRAGCRRSRLGLTCRAGSTPHAGGHAHGLAVPLHAEADQPINCARLPRRRGHAPAGRAAAASSGSATGPPSGPPNPPMRTARGLLCLGRSRPGGEQEGVQGTAAGGGQDFEPALTVSQAVRDGAVVLATSSSPTSWPLRGGRPCGWGSAGGSRRVPRR